MKIVRQALPGIGGLALGTPSAYLGVQLAKEHGGRVADTFVREGLRMAANGTIDPQRWVRALPYVTDPQIQMRVGGFALGLAGFAIGAALLWPLAQD